MIVKEYLLNILFFINYLLVPLFPGPIIIIGKFFTFVKEVHEQVQMEVDFELLLVQIGIKIFFFTTFKY